MDRITLKHLQPMVDRLNRITGSPAETWTNDADGKLIAQIGCYHLSRAYGGVSLHRMVTEGGGVSDVLYCGHVPMRDLYNRISAYICGIQDASSPR